VDWLSRLRHSVGEKNEVSNEPVPERIVRPAPGVATLLDGVAEDRSHAVLDLGPAAEASLRVYSRFARWVRFTDLLGGTAPARGPFEPTELTAQPEHPYDLVFTWDALGLLEPDERPTLVARIAEISAPDARLHVLIKASEEPDRSPLRFTLEDVGQISYESRGGGGVRQAPLLPADVERSLRPFEVIRAFSLMGGLREYVALKVG